MEARDEYILNNKTLFNIKELAELLSRLNAAWIFDTKTWNEVVKLAKSKLK